MLSVKSITFGIWVLVLACFASAQPCYPDNYPPINPAGQDCEWLYIGGAVVERTIMTAVVDKQKPGVWSSIPPCACGWYPVEVPCPGCPPRTITYTKTGTLTWSSSSAYTVQSALALKARFIAEAGSTNTLTIQQQNSLAGTDTDSVADTYQWAPILCFERWFRPVQWHHQRAGYVMHDWTFQWERWCNGYPSTYDKTHCTEEVARADVSFTSPANYEYAPQKPPCGGVAITIPDPWDRKRETPCCDTVCGPAPVPPAHRCCGCEFHTQ